MRPLEVIQVGALRELLGCARSWHGQTLSLISHDQQHLHDTFPPRRGIRRGGPCPHGAPSIAVRFFHRRCPILVRIAAPSRRGRRQAILTRAIEERAKAASRAATGAAGPALLTDAPPRKYFQDPRASRAARAGPASAIARTRCVTAPGRPRHARAHRDSRETVSVLARKSSATGPLLPRVQRRRLPSHQ